jgi:acyl-CoA reductase-like NAD-dependent aldehyde dehydrogenase
MGHGEPLVVRAPFTREPLGSLPSATRDDVDQAVRCARAAQSTLAAWLAEHRAGVLRRFHDLRRWLAESRRWT